MENLKGLLFPLGMLIVIAGGAISIYCRVKKKENIGRPIMLLGCLVSTLSLL